MTDRTEYLEQQVALWESRGYDDEKIRTLKERLRFLKSRS